MSNTLDILDCKGARVGEYVIPEGVIELEKGEQAVHDTVVAYLAGQRAGTACTKTRGEVSGGGAKPFRQKGMGRALSERIVEGDLVLLDKFELADHKTRNAFAILKNLNVANETVMISLPELDAASVCATGNIPNVVLRKTDTVNVYELLRFKKLLFTKDALDAFIQRLA